jgi:hypothetical protein
MKTKLYNRGGTKHFRLGEQMDSAVQRRKFYPANEKLRILSAVDMMMRAENFNQNEASVVLQVSVFFPGFKVACLR